MQISKEESGCVLRLQGELEIGAIGELHRALREFLEQGSSLVLDLSAVESCDAAALQLLYSAARTAANSGRHLNLQGVPQAVSDTAAALGLPQPGIAVQPADEESAVAL